MIGKYRLLLPIGFGGMATVYLARNEGPAGFRREVALKWVSANVPGFPDLATHLLREARIVGQIRHPNVVQMVDADEISDGIYLVMEYVEGGTLAALAAHALSEQAPLPLPIALRILGDALSGLHAAHELCDAEGRHLELVHRDFSPQNILIGVEGDVKLGDFGIAKVEHTSHRTRTGIVKGTVSYMSPEQVRGQPLDRRSDLWSAGVVAWELFAGKPFHDKREAIAAAMSTLTGRIPRLRSVRPELPEALDEAVALALTRTPARRCQTAIELRERLLAAAGVAPASTDELSAYARLAFAPELVARRAQIELGRPVASEPFAAPPEPAPLIESPPAPRSRRGWLAVAALLLVAAAIGVRSWRGHPRAATPESAPAVPAEPAKTTPTERVSAPPEPTSSEARSDRKPPPPSPAPPAPRSTRATGKGAIDSSAPKQPSHPATEAGTSVAPPAAPPLADNPYAHPRPDSK